ncbi:MAG TPA: lysylphosphatidylglycerol synthase transmembrane domain-containing protein [Candidatus Angelobacter sp.]|nr:lysylphosphatidylglycerol synthase transmembrane domain-containing protein [Candidatus Angelobacter sp.]
MNLSPTTSKKSQLHPDEYKTWSQRMLQGRHPAEGGAEAVNTCLQEASSPLARRFFFALVSLGTGALLIGLLLSRSHIALREILHHLRNVRLVPCALLTLLLGFNIFLSAMKWRLVDAVVRKRGQPEVSKLAAFTATTVGVALGQLLPTPVCMALSRSFGLYKEDRAAGRGVFGTIFEQSFDIVTVALLIPATVLVHLLHGGAEIWVLIAASTVLAGLLAVGPGMHLCQRIIIRLCFRDPANQNRFHRGISELARSGLLDAGLAQKLLMLSALRFLVLTAMAGETTRAIGLSIPVWHLAASMPFVVASTALSITPGGLGLNEITFAIALKMFGTPLGVATQWALANRILGAIASAMVVLTTIAFVCTNKWVMKIRTARLTPEIKASE